MITKKPKTSSTRFIYNEFPWNARIPLLEGAPAPKGSRWGMLARLLDRIRALMMGPSLAERRLEPRARCSMEISCLAKRGRFPITALDVSRSGVRFSCGRKLTLGQNLRLQPPGGLGGQSIQVVGEVVWCRKVHRGHYQAGFRFTESLSGKDWVSRLLDELGLSEAPPTQRRKHLRVPTRLPVSLRTQNGETQSAILKDMSLGGALVEVPFELPGQGIVRLKVGPLPNVGLLSLPTNIANQHKVSRGVHLCLSFHPLTPEEQKTVTDYLHYLMKNFREKK